MLDHPNIVRVEGWYCNETFSYELLEYCEYNLVNYLSENSLPENEVLRGVGQLAEGLAYLHKQGYIARLLPLQSIFMQKLDKNRFLFKIGMLDSLKLQQNVSKTVITRPQFNVLNFMGFYHAPELLEENRRIRSKAEDEIDDLTLIEFVGPHSDVFSLGVIFFEMLTR